MLKLTCIIIILVLSFFAGHAQLKSDNTYIKESQTAKFSKKVTDKIQIYDGRITTKTVKTLAKLSRWENKIHKLLEKVDPEAADKLFGNNQMTFTSMLAKVKEGQQMAADYKSEYDGYTDKLMTRIKYLKTQTSELDIKADSSLKKAGDQAALLQHNLSRSEYIKAFIKERKKRLFDEALQYVGKSKYFSKINKEGYYYAATLKNYKELFSDESKTEAAVKEALGKIPAFQKFMQNNSQLASLFRMPGNSSGVNDNPVQSLAGLQTRSSVQQIIQERISSGGPNGQMQVQQNLTAAQGEMNRLKDKINKLGGSSQDADLPDFKPNEQKSKTIWQRLEYGLDVQFAKNNSWMPSTSDIAGSLGFKLNDKSVAGIGISYKLGMGSIEHIHFSSEGVGLRSYLDWKAPFGSKLGILSTLWISGGYEMNYNSGFERIEQLKIYDAWQRSALAGISKKYQISKKVKGEMKLLYDFLANRHVPVSQPVVFRLGYKL